MTTETTQVVETDQSAAPVTDPIDTTGTDTKPVEQTEVIEETKPSGTLPETADAYVVELDGFDFSAFAENESNKEFIGKAHGLGITNEQMSAVLDAYNQHTAVQVEVLQEEWGGEFDANVRFAQQAVKAAGLTMDEIDSPTLGLKLAAYYGKQLQEDMPPQNTQESGAVDVASLMSSEAYMNDKHPDHKRVYAQVEQAYAKQYQ